MKYLLIILCALSLFVAAWAALRGNAVVSLAMVVAITQVTLIAVVRRLSRVEEQVRAHGMRAGK